jgi:hypothetical protein
MPREIVFAMLGPSMAYLIRIRKLSLPSPAAALLTIVVDDDNPTHLERRAHNGFLRAGPPMESKTFRSSKPKMAAFSGLVFHFVHASRTLGANTRFVPHCTNFAGSECRSRLAHGPDRRRRRHCSVVVTARSDWLNGCVVSSGFSYQVVSDSPSTYSSRIAPFTALSS